MSPNAKYRGVIVALLAYVLLAIILTYPLILHFTTHVAGDGRDDPALAWNLWWVPHAILQLGSSPISTQYMFYPIGLNLAFYTLTYLNAFLSIPLQFAFNLVVAANVNLLLSFALSGFGAYLLVGYLLRRSARTMNSAMVPWAAFIAGALYAFSANKMLYASLGQFNIASSHWIPFYILFLLKLMHAADSSSITDLTPFANGVGAPSSRVRTRPAKPIGIAEDLRPKRRGENPAKLPLPGPVEDPRNGVEGRRGRGIGLRLTWQPVIWYGLLAGLFLLFQALSEFIFASFLIIFTVAYWLYWLLIHRGQAARMVRTTAGLVIAAIVSVVPMAPILVAMIQDMLAEGDFIQQGLGFADVFSSDVLGFWLPSHLHPIFGGLESQFHFAYTNFAFLGWVALALAVVALWKFPAARIWGAFGALCILITLGPDLRVNGSATSIPFLPFNLLLEIPFVKGNRYPSRWSVMVTLCLAILIGYGVVWVGNRRQAKGLKAQALSGVILFLILFEHLSVPLPLSDFTIPDVYTTIARDQDDFTVLEIPLAWRNGFRMTGTQDSEMMFEQWYQTQHEHPLLGGNTSRNPELKFQYFTEAPVINSLIAVETGHPLDDATIQQDKLLAGSVLSFFNVRYVVWHSPRNPDNRAALQAALNYIEQVLPITKFYDQSDETGQTVAFRVNEKVAGAPSQVRADSLWARLNLAEGWGTVGAPVVWATRREAKLFLWQSGNAAPPASLVVRLFAPVQNQSVQVLLNDQAIGEFKPAQGWGEYKVPVPESGWCAGINSITLRFAQLAPVDSVRVGDFSIGKTGTVAPVSLVVRSAGSEVGDFGHIFVNGTDAAPNGIGYNVVVVNPQTGKVEATGAFNTFQSEAESARLAQFVRAIPVGRIVAAAVRDEASRDLTSDAVDALRSIGAETDLRGKWRWSHALIGVKGAAPGTALEMAGATMPAQLVAGVGAMEPNVAVALEWIRVQ